MTLRMVAVDFKGAVSVEVSVEVAEHLNELAQAVLADKVALAMVVATVENEDGANCLADALVLQIEMADMNEAITEKDFDAVEAVGVNGASQLAQKEVPVQEQLKPILEAVCHKLSAVTFLNEKITQVEALNHAEQWAVRTTLAEYVTMHPGLYEHPTRWRQAFKAVFVPAFMLRSWQVETHIVDPWVLTNNKLGPMQFFPNRNTTE